MTIRVIDSHTEGEPTRLVLSGMPDLEGNTMAEKRASFARLHNEWRKRVILEPRGHDAMVGALLCEASDPGCEAGLIFFNNEGVLGMCGHATIGAAVTLAWLGRLQPGAHSFETPVGKVDVELVNRNEAVITNVPSYRQRANVTVNVPGFGEVHGDIAWGGNWFFLTSDRPCDIIPENARQLTAYAEAIGAVLEANGIRGRDGAPIDHVEVFGPGSNAGTDSRNFVLCPGGSIDRSPCGTGTSAKLACLAAEGRLAPGKAWTQEGICGGRFIADYQRGTDGCIVPRIRGRAHVVKDATLIVEPDDPFANGLTLG